MTLVLGGGGGGKVITVRILQLKKYALQESSLKKMCNRVCVR